MMRAQPLHPIDARNDYNWTQYMRNPLLTAMGTGTQSMRTPGPVGGRTGSRVAQPVDPADTPSWLTWYRSQGAQQPYPLRQSRQTLNPLIAAMQSPGGLVAAGDNRYPYGGWEMWT